MITIRIPKDVKPDVILDKLGSLRMTVHLTKPHYRQVQYRAVPKKDADILELMRWAKFTDKRIKIIH
jgi:hypothetical protein